MFKVEIISGSIFKNKTSIEKIDTLLYYIKGSLKDGVGKILVVEEPLTPKEEAMLIEETMLGIDEKFKGIEVAVIREESTSLAEKIAAILGVRKGITVIGPSNIIQKIKREKEPQKILLEAIANVHIESSKSKELKKFKENSNKIEEI
ncbi:MAG: DUF2073 domain-containing protein [Candidatus Altarchaeaceae archaeon]